MGDVVNFFSGLTYHPSDVKNKGYFVIRSSNIQNNQIVSADDIFVNKDIINVPNVKQGDIIVVVRNGSRKLIGKHAQVLTDMPNTVIGAFMTGVRSKSNFYINALLDSDQFQKEIYKNLGATINQITIGEFRKMRFIITSGNEAQTIGEFFKKIDTLITLQQRKLNQLKRLKTAMLQQLLANQSFPKVRFNNFKNSWKDYRLGEVFDEFSVKSKRENEYKLLSSTTSGMESRSGRVSGHSNIGYKVIDNGDIVLSPQNLWLGNINLNNMGKGIVSPSYHTFKIVNANPIFVNFQLKTKKMLFEYKMVSVQGASVVRRNLDMDAFKKIVIKIPNEKEQIKIASLFSSISNIINNHQNKLTQLTTLKKYLLQKMFI